MASRNCKKLCNLSRICNPQSGRCVLKSGKIGQLLKLKKFRSKSKPKSRSKSKPKSKLRSRSRDKSGARLSAKSQAKQSNLPEKESRKISKVNEPIEAHKKSSSERKSMPVTITGQKIEIPIIKLIEPVDPLLPFPGKKQVISFKVSKSFLADYNTSNLTEFLDNNRRYLEGCSMRQKLILSGYTRGGDELVNMYLLKDFQDLRQYIFNHWRSGGNLVDYMFNPMYYQLRELGGPENVHSMQYWLERLEDEVLVKTIMSAIEKYIGELTRIFDKSPKLTKPIIVYRGTKSEYYKDKSDIFHNTTFMSTSLSPKIALGFINTLYRCCFKEIHLVPGAKAIFLEPLTQQPKEVEVLLPPGTKFRITEIIKDITQIPQNMEELQLFQNFEGENAKVAVLHQIV